MTQPQDHFENQKGQIKRLVRSVRRLKAIMHRLTQERDAARAEIERLLDEMQRHANANMKLRKEVKQLEEQLASSMRNVKALLENQWDRTQALQDALREAIGMIHYLNECDPWFGTQTSPTVEEILTSLNKILATDSPPLSD